MTTPNPPPEAALITRRFKARVPRISAQDAARQAGISYATWRNITRGLRYQANGTTTIYRAEPEVLARIALTLGIEPEDLQAVDRHDAARYLTTTLSTRNVLSTFTSKQLLDELASRLREDDPHGVPDTAPTRRAEVSSAHMYDLAAMAGQPEHLPDTTTGEESQDPGPGEESPQANPDQGD